MKNSEYFLSRSARRVYNDLKQEMKERVESGNTDQSKYDTNNDNFIDQRQNTLELNEKKDFNNNSDLETKDLYTLNEFLNYHDHKFIINAYKCILRRSPDSSGYRYFLKSLHNGHLTKIEILGRLRFSKEGRSRRVKVKGLLLPFVVQTSYKIPLLGYLIMLTSNLLRLPFIIRNFIRFETYVNKELSKYNELYNEKMKQIESSFQALQAVKADREEVSREMSELAQVKADREEVSREMSELAQVKADREEVSREMSELAQVKADCSETSELFKQIYDLKNYILDQQRRLNLLLEEARKRLPAPISHEQLRVMVQEDDHILDAMYVSFEDQFRGTREDIRNRVSTYLPFIRKANAGSPEFPVVDIGCGRGEWLELLKAEGFTATGFDLNRIMIKQCLELGLDVFEQDAIKGLRKYPPNSVGAVTGMHIIEHLPFKQLISMLDESLRVIKPGGVVIFETPNPENLLVGSCNFYLDPGHLNPIPPPLSKFIAEARGFVRTQILRLHPNEDLAKTLTSVPEVSKHLSGPQDYALIAYKAG